MRTVDCGLAGALVVCANAEDTRKSSGIRQEVLSMGVVSGHDYCVLWLQEDVLFRVFPFDYLFVVEADTGVSAVGILSQDVDVRFFREGSEASGLRDGVEDGRGSGQGIGAGLGDATQDIEVATVDLEDHHRHVGVMNIGLEFNGDGLFQLRRRSAGGLHGADERECDSAVGAYRERLFEVRFVPDVDSQDIAVADDIGFLLRRLGGRRIDAMIGWSARGAVLRG